MRVFVALDLEESLRQKIALYLRGLEGFAPDARWAKPDALHVTLKFIGEQPHEKVSEIQKVLETIHFQPISLEVRGCGFFPTLPAARVFWLGIAAAPELASLASAIDAYLSPLGISREQHAFTPHLTLARTGSGAPRPQRKGKSGTKFQGLQQRLSAMPPPDFGTMTAREFFLYESKLSPQGSRYTKLASFPLRG